MSNNLQQAITTIKAGDKETGKQLLIEVLKSDQRNETAWLWMTRVVDSDDERIKCLRNVLKINPNNEIAKRGLATYQQQTLNQSQQIELHKIETQAEPIELPPPILAEPQSSAAGEIFPVLRKPKPIATQATRKCPHCAKIIKVNATFCSSCGKSLETGSTSPVTNKQQPSRTDNTLQKFLGEQQDPIVAQQVHQRVSQILTRDEEILYIAVQKPLISLSPDSIVLTNRRFIIYKPKLLGGVDFEDYIWRDLNDVKLKEGMINSSISMKTTGGHVVFIEHLPKAQARKLYAFAQEREEQVREERRIREMEEKRAAAGGIVFQGSPSFPNSVSVPISPTPVDPLQKLTQLKAMLDAGLITQQEYDAKKTDLLSRM